MAYIATEFAAVAGSLNPGFCSSLANSEDEIANEVAIAAQFFRNCVALQPKLQDVRQDA